MRVIGVSVSRQWDTGKPGDNVDVLLTHVGYSGHGGWCQQAERDSGQRAGLTSAEKDRIKDLEREVRELRQANEILKKASAYFAAAELDRPFKR